MSKQATYSVDMDAGQAEREARNIGQRINRALNQGMSSGTAAASRGFGNPATALAGGLAGGIAGYLTVAGARSIVEGAKGWAEYSRAATNAATALASFTGSAKDAAETIDAIQAAAGYSFDSFAAMQIANKQLALGLVESNDEFERLISVSGKAATLTGKDLTQAIDAVNLSAANLRTARLDEIGISATKVKERFAELRGEMDESRAMLLAILDVGEETFAGFDVEKSGFAQLAATISDIKDDAIGAGTQMDTFASKVALQGREYVKNNAAMREANEVLQISIGALTDSQQEAQAAIAEAMDAYDLDALRSAIDAWNAAGEAAEPTVVNMYEVSEATKQANREFKQIYDAAVEAAGGIDAFNESAATTLFLNIPGGLSAVEQRFNQLQNILNQYTPAAIKAQRFGTDISAVNLGYEVTSEGQSQARRDLKAVSAENERQKREEAKRTSEAQIKEWERASSQMARDFEAEMSNAMRGIEGLFDPSQVTESDMAAAAAGTYVEKVDEYLRQLRDEVRSGKDYAGVDIRDAAARAGIDMSLPAEEILRQFEEAWADSSLFAGGANLDLFNEDAIQRGIDRQRASKSGEEAIAAYFEAMYGPGVATRAVGAPNETAASYVSQFEGALKEQTGTEEAEAGFMGFGQTLVEFVYQGFWNGAGELDWVGAILANAQAQAADAILETLAETVAESDATGATP